MFQRKGDVMVEVWKDKRLVQMISTIHEAAIGNLWQISSVVSLLLIHCIRMLPFGFDVLYYVLMLICFFSLSSCPTVNAVCLNYKPGSSSRACVPQRAYVGV
jgi:hypothetical protein